MRYIILPFQKSIPRKWHLFCTRDIDYIKHVGCQWIRSNLALRESHSHIITDWAIGTVSSLLKIKNVESQKIKRTPFCGFERSSPSKSLKSKYQVVFAKTLNKTKFGFVQNFCKKFRANFYWVIERSNPQKSVLLIFLWFYVFLFLISLKLCQFLGR